VKFNVGPGAGKGTQCAKLVEEFNFVHLSAGDLLRAERMREGSPYGDLINKYIADGQIVPMEITVALLHSALKSNDGNLFLVDGFPRKMDQALKFEEKVCPSKFVLFFDCSEDTMLKRLLKRGNWYLIAGETSGRVDDNLESIKKRFETFKETSYPVVEHYEKLGKVHRVILMIIQITCDVGVDEVYAVTQAAIKKELGL
jgi:UMP-CMP kinase